MGARRRRRRKPAVVVPPPPLTLRGRVRQAVSRSTPAVIALGAVSICVLVLVVIFGRSPLVIGAEPVSDDQSTGSVGNGISMTGDPNLVWVPVQSSTAAPPNGTVGPTTGRPSETSTGGQSSTRPPNECRHGAGAPLGSTWLSRLLGLPTEDPPTTEPPTTEPPTTEPPTTSEPPTTEPPTTEPPTTEPPTTEPPTTEPPTTEPPTTEPPTTPPTTTPPGSPPPTSSAPPT